MKNPFKIKRIIDISMDLNEKTIVWINDPQPKLKRLATMPKDPVNFTWLDFGGHAGTHVDAPFYLFSEKWTADKIPLNRMIGKCQVIDLTKVKDMICIEDLKKIKIKEKIILLKTKNSFDNLKKYNPNHVALSLEAAKYLIQKEIKTIGYDYQSFERQGKNEVHKIFLSKDITVIDNLRLKQTRNKNYFLICLPIKLIGTDAAPARAILIEE
jgi:arylformamidase